MRKLFAVFILLNCFILTGCFQGEMSLKFDNSGKIMCHNKIIGIPYIANQIEEIKNDFLKRSPNAQVKNISEGNFSGYDVVIEYKNLDEFNSKCIDFYSAKQGKSTGITKTNNWFYDSYNIDLFIEGNKSMSSSKNEYEQLGESMAQAMLSQIKFDLKMEIPNPSETNNADVVSNEGKILSWNLVNSLINGQDKQIKANFKIWNTMNIIITVVALIVLAGIIIKFMKKNKKVEDVE